MTERIRIGVVGAGGRMGRTLIAAVLDAPDCVLHGAIDRAGAEAIGEDAGVLSGRPSAGVIVGESAPELFASVDAVLDFTVPAASVEFAALAAQGKTAHIIGTTGLSAEDEAALSRAARHTQVVYAPNMSVGVTLLMALTEQAARALGDEFDIEVLEMHHRGKADAPSGTALGLGRAAAAGRGIEHEEVAVRVRDGVTGPRPAGAIGYATLRGGGVIGDHSVIFAGDAERVELTHKAASRDIYAAGALRAVRWAMQQKTGLYSMRDVLGL